MKEGESVNGYFSRTLTVAKKMKSCGEEVKESMINEKILRSMTNKVNYVICSMEEMNDQTTMSLDELQSSLLVHEQMMNYETEDEQQLKVTAMQSAGRGQGESRGGGRGEGRGRGRQGSRLPVDCYNCHKLGHIAYYCLEKGSNYAELEETKKIVLMAYVEAQGGRRDRVWFLDSGSSNHITGNKVGLSTFPIMLRTMWSWETTIK